jgi:hypothetical protein
LQIGKGEYEYYNLKSVCSYNLLYFFFFSKNHSINFLCNGGSPTFAALNFLTKTSNAMNFYPPRTRAVIYLLAGTFFLASCQKDIKFRSENEETIFANTPKEKETVEVLKEVSAVLEEVYQKPKAYYEANAAIYSEYYADERVLLKDLLFPETSPLYKTDKFKSFKAIPGEFKKEFYEILAKNEFPNLKKVMRISNLQHRIAAAVPTDTSMEIFSNSTGVSIYFPYSENFGSNFTPAYFDNINQPNLLSYLATVIPADREADSAQGRKPSKRKIGTNFFVTYTNVMVKDSYAELNPTHIVGVGAEPAKPSGVQEPQQVYLVFIGEVRLKKQYDRFISLSGNGGGSEIRFGRGDAYLTLNPNQQITSFQNIVPANIKRKRIKNGNWVPVYIIWDSNWELDNKQQVFSIWEEDKEGTATFNLSIKTTVKIGPNVTGEGTVGFSVAVKTQDELIRQLGWNRESFYLYNRGGLNNGCGTRNGWTVYDCFSNIEYTMPQQ